jgi:acetolactate synthase-1/2/3 large subunit
MSTANLRLTGGDLIAQTLRKAGVRRVFALHGGHLEAVLKGCVDEGIDMIDFRHEASAGHAADAYARTTGELGVCIVTAGPGFTNAITAISNAYLDGSPVLFILGAPPLREAETNPLQGGIDQIAMIRPTVKWAHSATTTERLADLTAMAIRQATTGRRGPVVLEVPIDVLHSSVLAEAATRPTGLMVRPHPAPSPSEAAAFVEMLRAARRPALIVGMEAISQRNSQALIRFAEAAKVPVFVKAQAIGMLPSDHPLDGGAAGNLAILPMIGVERPDLVILLGARLGLLLGGRSGSIVPDDARVVQICGDAGEIGRMRDIDLPIEADCAEALDAVLAAAGGDSLAAPGDWPARAVAAKALFAQAYPDVDAPGGVHPYHAAKAVMDAAGRGAVYVMDGGEAASWAGACVKVDGPGRVLTHGYLGCLGVGPGFSIGAQLAHPGRRVIHITGDGAMGFNIQELDTMARHKLPVITVVMNNQVWGMSIHGQQIMFGQNYSVITRLGMTRYADIAGAFGCHGERVDRFDQIAPAMQRALDSGKPALIEIMTDAEVIHPVTLAMLGKVGDSARDVMIPYYENIPAEAG